NLTAIVVDGADRDRVLRVLESMVGLRAGTLVPEPELSNRSLTLAEVETIRAFNAAFRAEGLGTQLHAKVMRFGAAELMKRRVADRDEPRIQTPSWAVDRAAEVGREIVEGIRSSGVRVIGDLASLVAPSATAAAADRARAPSARRGGVPAAPAAADGLIAPSPAVTVVQRAKLLLPEGTRLVHIGPPKTGTTAVQGAFHARRREVLAQGVRYAGRSRHS